MAAEEDLDAIEQLILDLQSQLDEANKTIATLQQQVDSLSSGQTMYDVAENSYANKLELLRMRYIPQADITNAETTNEEPL